MRKTIARRLVESKTTIPHFYLSIDVDAMALVSLKEKINADLASSPSPSKVSLNDLFIKACGVALKRVPDCNASYTPDAIRIHSRVDISIAVAIPDGLVTPVIRDVDRKTLVSVAAEVRELAARARARKLKPEEMQDGTFSITNLGMFGVDSFSAVINPPEAAILAIGAVRDVPVVTEGAVVPGKRIQLTLSCDHRVVDGATGAAFLSELRQLIEHPMRTLTG
jgi:pyruvate dehydrogenase E2 component (dihydrolipoamide acetyltransferase)